MVALQALHWDIADDTSVLLSNLNAVHVSNKLATKEVLVATVVDIDRIAVVDWDDLLLLVTTLAGTVVIRLAIVTLGEHSLEVGIIGGTLDKVVNLVVDGEDIHDIKVVGSHELIVSMVPLCSDLSLWLAGVPGTVEVLWPIKPRDKREDVPWTISTELHDLGDALVLKGQDGLIVVVAWPQGASL